MAIVNYEKAITLVDKPWFVAHFKQRVANLHYHLGDAKRAIQLFEETIPFAIQAPQLEWFDNNPYGFQVYISSISILDAQIVNAYIQISDRTGAVRLYDKLSLMNREGEITTKYEGLDNLRRKINDAWPGAI
jgi:tetratricopeptide (TPR) repeat protein